MTDRGAVEREIDEGPRHCLRVLADMDDEEGDAARALGYRWLAYRGRWPLRCERGWVFHMTPLAGPECPSGGRPMAPYYLPFSPRDLPGFCWKNYWWESKARRSASEALRDAARVVGRWLAERGRGYRCRWPRRDPETGRAY